MFRGDLTAELNWYHPHGAAIVEAYVKGVNAYIAEAMKNPATLPVEFKMLGITPQPWTPAAVISRHNGLLGNIGQEVNMAQAVRVLGAEGVKDARVLPGRRPGAHAGPGDRPVAHQLEHPRSLHRLPRADPLHAGRDRAGLPRQAGAAAALDEAIGPSAIDLSTRQEDIGSNDWVVSGRLTAERLSDDDERPAPHAERAVAALLGAPGRARLERHRRRRAGAARRVDRPQRVRRVGPDDLRQRQRGSLRVRHEPGESEPIQVPRRSGKTCASSRTRSR